MLLPDVNVYISAFRRESPRHEAHQVWLEDTLNDVEPVGVSGLVLSAFLRIVTNPRIYRVPSTPEAAVGFCDAVRAAPASVPVEPGSRHWSTFSSLVTTQRLRANDVPDAYLAALALEHDATLVTTDRGFARYGGLRLRPPLDDR